MSADSYELVIKGINVGNAEDILAKAKNALHRNKTRKAKRLLEEAKREIQNAVKRYETAVLVLTQARDIIKEAIEKKVDISKAKALFIQARLELRNGNYDEVVNLAQMAVRACRPEPLYGKDIAVRTAIGYEDGVLKYKINIQNLSEYPLKNFHVKPILPESSLVPDIPEEVIPYMKPQEEKNIDFELGIVESEGSKTIVPGRDLIIQTITSMERGESDIVHKMKIENMTLEPLYNVSIQPFLPKNQFESYPPEEIIPVLEPNYPKTLKFRLRPIIDKISVKQIKEDFMHIEKSAPPSQETAPPPPPPPSPVPKKKKSSPPPPPESGGASKKVIYECPECRGPFIVETSDESAIVACPWCDVKVSVGDVKKELVEGGSKIKPVGEDEGVPPPPPPDEEVVTVAPVEENDSSSGGSSEFDKLFPESGEVLKEKKE